MKQRFMRAAGGVLRRTSPAMPLSLRKRAALLSHRLPGSLEDALIPVLLHDWASTEPADYHRFVWSHHLLYAKYYDFREIEHSRGRYFERLHPLRAEILETVARCLRERGVSPDRDVRSVLDVGCSLGYLLRHAEVDVFPAAQRLIGIDIDEHAIAEGSEFLRAAGSKVDLDVADLEELERVAGSDRFDVVTCTGVLQYLDERAAGAAVAALLDRTGRLLALSGLACEDVDNAEIDASRVRGYDGSRFHNFDRMVAAGGGRVVARRWAGSELVEGRHGAYYVVAAPAR